MPFLTIADYGTQIKEDHLNTILNEDDALRTKAELTAQEEIESYLRSRYDVAAVFSAANDDRSNLIITYMVDLTLYHLWSRHGRVQMPEKRVMRYEQAIDWLKACRAGKVTANLPKLPETDITRAKILWGGAERLNNDW
jgi:phage gp36-like protein